jgi:hypothetical protein
MIIKKMDSKQEEMAELTALLKGRLTSNQRFLIEMERTTGSGRNIQQVRFLNIPCF